MPTIIAWGSFDDLRSRHVRFLEEASKLGDVHVLLWSDEAVRSLTGQPPEFPQEERLYLIQAIRYVNRVTLVTDPDSPDVLPSSAPIVPAFQRRAESAKGAEAPWAAPRDSAAITWAVDETDDIPASRAFCADRGITYRVFGAAALQGFPDPSNIVHPPSSIVHRPSVLVTGCYDWLHSGHVRFFEEASTYGDLTVVVGNDANVRHLKGEGHPMQTQAERRYMIGAIRYVKQALISTGWGWLDAEPEIERLKPDTYLVNEDGDKPEKREYCAAHGLQYVVLKRTPKEGLPRRSSSDLRGF